MYDFQAKSKVMLFNSRWLQANIDNDSRFDHTYYVRLYHVKSKREFILKDKSLIEVGVGVGCIDWSVVLKDPKDSDVKGFIDSLK